MVTSIRSEDIYIYTLTLLVLYLHMRPEETLAHLHRTHASAHSSLIYNIEKLEITFLSMHRRIMNIFDIFKWNTAQQ